MKKLLTIAVLIFISGRMFAQNNPPPLPSREVSGIVKDSKGQTIPGATVSLTSAKDTMNTSTNEDGIFIFKDVKLATFVITIKALGQVTSTRKYLNNDAIKRIILDPVEMKDEMNMLNQVTINGTPSITYKTDTVEYRASDYKVRENATVDELLKKMEGMEVGTDGTLTHQGQQVTKARLNGKDYAGGDVAQAIQNLPAEIIEKIQVVDDYGDQAGRTGVKNGDPTKVLNMTTRADKSVGNLARITASGGSDDRYDERLFTQRINANQQLGIIGNFRNTVNGVASSGINTNTGGAAATGGGGGGGGGGSGGGGNGGGGGNFGGGGGASVSSNSGGGSGGTTTAGSPSFNYRDQWGKSIQVNASYRYTFNNVNSLNNSTGQNVYTYRVGQTTQTGVTSTVNNSTGVNNNKTHNASFEFEFAPDSSNFLRITPSFSYTGTTTSNDFEETQTGFQNQFSKGISSSTNTTPNYGVIALYQYIFKKNHRRNISIQFNLTHGDQQQNSEQNTNITYRDPSQVFLRDSLIHRSVDRGNVTKNYRASLTYVEPLSPLSQLEFNGQMNYRGYDNTAITDSIAPNGDHFMLQDLSNIYKYSFTETRFALNYRLNQRKYNISLGLTAIPTHLEGTNISKATSTDRNNFYLVPLFRFQYQWSRQQQLSINYTGTPTEPSFTQIQPIPDVSNPLNTVYGNPNLKPSFRHTVVARYNNYMSNSKINLSANVSGSLNNDQIVSNTILVQQSPQSFVRETHYTNLSGGKSLLGNYNIAKQFDDRRYNLSLNGTMYYDYTVGMNDNVLNHVSSWSFTERFGPRINPNTSLEVNPFVSYELNRSFNTLSTLTNTNYTRTAMNLEGKFYFGKDKTWTFEYDLSKSFVNGISANVTKNPFVANAYLEKEFFQRKNGILRLSVFDLFNQNNFVNRVVNQNGYTDTKTNALSRYVMVSFILNLQKWSGVSQRNGRNMQRRGDGSFIY